MEWNMSTQPNGTWKQVAQPQTSLPSSQASWAPQFSLQLPEPQRTLQLFVHKMENSCTNKILTGSQVSMQLPERQGTLHWHLSYSCTSRKKTRKISTGSEVSMQLPERQGTLHWHLSYSCASRKKTRKSSTGSEVSMQLPKWQGMLHWYVFVYKPGNSCPRKSSTSSGQSFKFKRGSRNKSKHRAEQTSNQTARQKPTKWGVLVKQLLPGFPQIFHTKI